MTRSVLLLVAPQWRFEHIRGFGKPTLTLAEPGTRVRHKRPSAKRTNELVGLPSALRPPEATSNEPGCRDSPTPLQILCIHPFQLTMYVLVPLSRSRFSAWRRAGVSTSAVPSSQNPAIHHSLTQAWDTHAAVTPALKEKFRKRVSMLASSSEGEDDDCSELRRKLREERKWRRSLNQPRGKHPLRFHFHFVPHESAWSRSFSATASTDARSIDAREPSTGSETERGGALARAGAN